MTARRRVLGEIARKSHPHVTGIDVASLLRRLILFDQVVIKSVRLRELPFLVRTFGKSGIITALEAGLIKLSCEFTSLIENIEINGVSHVPPDHFSFGIVEIFDREKQLRSEFCGLQSIPGLKNAQRAEIEEAAWNALVRPAQTFGADLQLQIESDLRRNTPALRASLIHVLKAQEIYEEARAPYIEMQVEETSPKIFRVRHNLTNALSIPLEHARSLVRRAVSGANGLNHRLAEMAAYSAISGFAEDEAPLLFGKLSGIIGPLNPTETEEQFTRVAEIAGIGEPLPGSMIDIDAVLEIRDSNECRAFKNWLDDAGSLSDEELAEIFTSLRSKLGLWLSKAETKMFRFAAVTGLGLVPGAVVPAAILSFVDNFLVEKLLPRSGIVSFLKSQYPSIYEH